jgi:hypothetical protein
MRSVRRSMCAGMLGLQAVVLFLVGVTLPSVTDVGAGAGIGIGLGLAVLCVVGAGLMRRPFGVWLGWAVQVLSLALGFVITAMFALGVVFLVLYAGAYFLGAKIDRERAERTQSEAA